MPDPKPETVRLTIDGTTVAVPKGTLVIEAARRVGVMIPHFCYHPKLKPDANCRSPAQVSYLIRSLSLRQPASRENNSRNSEGSPLSKHPARIQAALPTTRIACDAAGIVDQQGLPVSQGILRPRRQPRVLRVAVAGEGDQRVRERL